MTVNLHRLTAERYRKALKGGKPYDLAKLKVVRKAGSMGELQNWALSQFNLRFVFDEGLPFGGCWSDVRRGGYFIPCPQLEKKA
jgi:hypothetical protein